LLQHRQDGFQVEAVARGGMQSEQRVVGAVMQLVSAHMQQGTLADAKGAPLRHERHTLFGMR
jgi:hypothetical protein